MSCWLQDPVTSSAGEKLKPLSTVWVMDQISSLSMLIRYLQRCYPIFLLPKFLVSSPFAYGEQSQGIDPPATPHNRRDFFWRPLKKKRLLKADWLRDGWGRLCSWLWNYRVRDGPCKLLCAEWLGSLQGSLQGLTWIHIDLITCTLNDNESFFS